MNCPFCNINYNDISNTIIEQTDNFFILPSKGSLCEGYLLIVPKKHIFSMHLDECIITSSFNYYLGNQQIVAVKSMDENDPDVQKVLSDIKTYIR